MYHLYIYFYECLEPGYYEQGQFGIRIENVMIIKKTHIESKSDVEFLGFEHITLVPIQKKLIDFSLLTLDQKNWIDSYHKECRNTISPYLKPHSPGCFWLQKETEPLN
jgi:Xaa-Pro aminopeptidase